MVSNSSCVIDFNLNTHSFTMFTMYSIHEEILECHHVFRKGNILFIVLNIWLFSYMTVNFKMQIERHLKTKSDCVEWNERS